MILVVMLLLPVVGAVIAPLADTLGEMLSIQLHPASELVPGGDDIDDCNSFVQAIGIALA